MNNKKNFKIIFTLATGMLFKKNFEKMAKRKDVIFRINGAHANDAIIKKIYGTVKKINKHANVLLDLPGNKVRLSQKKTVKLRLGRQFTLTEEDVNDSLFFCNIGEGDVIQAQDSTLSFKVISVGKENKEAVFEAMSEGLLKKGKGLHKKDITKDILFPSLRDRYLIKKAFETGINYLGVSYIRNAKDIKSLREHLPKGYEPELYVKLETNGALKNLGSITGLCDNFILDRGDLAGEVGLENIPESQDRIVKYVLAKGKNIFLATQFLRNMVSNPVPLIAEVNDMANVLKKGISGIQLSEETAIGKYPGKCFELIDNMKNKYYRGK